MQPVFDAIAESSVRLCGALFGAVFRFDGELVHLVAYHNYSPDARAYSVGLFPAPLDRRLFATQAIRERGVVHIRDVLSVAADYPSAGHVAQDFDFRSVLVVPMLRGGEPIGAVQVWHADVAPFSEVQISLLQTFADQAVIAIENVRLFKELEARNSELTEILARQTATGEVLRGISQAQTDAQPVFEIIAASACRLCGAAYAQVQLYDGELIHLAALESANPGGDAAIRAVYPLRVGDGSAGGRAIATRAVTQIPDLLDDLDLCKGVRRIPPPSRREGDGREGFVVPAISDGRGQRERRRTESGTLYLVRRPEAAMKARLCLPDTVDPFGPKGK